MIVYFDECYDGAHAYLILGALFCPDHRQFHSSFLKAKRDLGYVDSQGGTREIKYSLCSTHYHYKVAVAGIDCFMASQSWFRAVVVDQRPSSGFSLDYFGGRHETTAMKKARAYKKFSELLLRSNLKGVSSGVLFADRLTRCSGDRFLSLIEGLFGCSNDEGVDAEPTRVFKHLQEVDTAREAYHVGQIGDLLQGAILNELVPTRNRYKRRLSKYVASILTLSSLGPQYWRAMPKWKQDLMHPKYQIWYWMPSP